MLDAWQNFLTDKGAEFTGKDVANFGAAERERRIICAGTVMVDLSHLGILKISGADAAEFLQNQLTNDVMSLSEGKSQYSAWCNIKGRVVTMLLVLRLADSYLLILPNELISAVGQKLAQFILRSDVKLEQIINQVIIGISGPKAYEEIKSINLDSPDTEFNHTYIDEVLISAIPGLMPRLIIVSGVEKLSKIWSDLDVNLAPVGKNPWNLTEVRAGIPQICKNTSEMFVPQMLNLDTLPAIDFKKGCYPGQEVVARMHYLGKPKRRLFHVEIERDDLPEPGAELKSATSTSGQGAGNIVLSALNGDGNVEALAVLELATLENNDLTDGDGNALKYTEIDY